ncbi:addiction module toxin, Txe/YoeB [Calothrix sp. NIES-4071]|nr:addiction module toxin, Txe/YoeB [Calothrix sp. NIES-4071]BAZ58294.1 addiction module toxin, Txe/YoeB [Calothrix sp. NIES-4105]
MGAEDDIRRERIAVFQSEFLEDLEYWVDKDRKVALRILKIVKEVIREPFEGIGKPEPLKYEYSGCWSRRINKEHRLVYLVTDSRINFVSARYHYE